MRVPEDAEDEDGCDQRDEGDTVSNGVADLHLPEEPPLWVNNHKQTQTNKQEQTNDTNVESE